MASPPVYEVEYIPLERRLGDRRVAPPGAPLPPDVPVDRRKPSGRRAEEDTPAGAPEKKEQRP